MTASRRNHPCESLLPLLAALPSETPDPPASSLLSTVAVRTSLISECNLSPSSSVEDCADRPDRRRRISAHTPPHILCMFLGVRGSLQVDLLSWSLALSIVHCCGGITFVINIVLMLFFFICSASRLSSHSEIPAFTRDPRTQQQHSCDEYRDPGK